MADARATISGFVEALTDSEQAAATRSTFREKYPDSFWVDFGAQRSMPASCENFVVVMRPFWTCTAIQTRRVRQQTLPTLSHSVFRHDTAVCVQSRALNARNCCCTQCIIKHMETS